MDAYSFGQYLRNARESREIELEEAVAALRIRQPILEAFEAGEFVVANLSEIQVRGMLRNYAGFLQLDEDHVLREYNEARFGKKGRGRWRWSRKRRARASRDHTERSDAAAPMQEIDIEQIRAARRSRWFSIFLLLLFSAAAIAVIAFVSSELIELPGSEEGDDALILAESASETAPSATRLPPPTFTPIALTPTPSNRRPFGGSGVLASISTTQRTWIRVSSDGVEQYAGIAVPGDLLEYGANSEVLVTASNAMGLDIVWNGRPQGPIGGRGQRVDIRFTIDEVAVSLGPPGAPTLISPTSPVAETIAATESVAVIVTATPDASVAQTLSSTAVATLTETATPSYTPVPSATSTPTASATPTPTMTPTVSAILPPRVTQVGLPPTKEGA